MSDRQISGDGVKFHDDLSRADILLPQKMTYDDAIKALTLHKQAMEQYVETEVEFFPALYDDGLVQAAIAVEELFGINFSSGSMFDPPKMKNVKTSLTTTREVPTGQVAIPSIEATLYLKHGVNPMSPEKGRVFTLQAYVRRMDQHHITKLVARIKELVKTNSIYRGQAVQLTSAGALEYIDVSLFADPRKVAFNLPVQKAIQRYVFGPMERRNELKALGISQKRVDLAYGPFGTGKSTLGQLGARVAVQTGHTAILGGPAADLTELMRVAALYGPSFAFVEDIDNVANVHESGKVSALLEAFDGVVAKGADVKLLMTTNHIDRIHPGMMRPGRIDSWFYIGPSDRETTERLIRVNTDNLADDVDFDALWEVTEGFTPSYIHEVLKKALIAAAIDRPDQPVVITTDDLLVAAETVQAQWKLQQDAIEPPAPPALDAALGGLVRGVVNSALESDDTLERLVYTSSRGVANNLDDVRSIVRGAVSDAIDATVVMDPQKEVTRGALDVR